MINKLSQFSYFFKHSQSTQQTQNIYKKFINHQKQKFTKKKQKIYTKEDIKELENKINQELQRIKAEEIEKQNWQEEQQEKLKREQMNQVAFMITRQMKVELNLLGYSLAEIQSMKPKDAQFIIKGNIKKTM